jgi:hypothetical protein
MEAAVIPPVNGRIGTRALRTACHHRASLGTQLAAVHFFRQLRFPCRVDRGGQCEQLDHLESEVSTRPAPPAGIHPHLVFRVPLAPHASTQVMAELLERLGIGVVSIESDNAIIAFQNDADLTQFRDALASYERGPQDGINPQTGQPYVSTQWDVLEYIVWFRQACMNLSVRQGRMHWSLLRLWTRTADATTHASG